MQLMTITAGLKKFWTYLKELYEASLPDDFREKLDSLLHNYAVTASRIWAVIKTIFVSI